MIYEQIPTDKPLYFVAYSPDGTRHIGTTPIGHQTHSGQASFISAESEQDVMIQADTDGVDFTGYRELPEVGEMVSQGIWSFGSEMVICGQAHERTGFTPSETPALFSTFRDAVGTLIWIENEQVEVGTIRIYNDVEYECIQAHQTQSDWTPDSVTALWKSNVVVAPTGEWTAGEAVAIGDIRSYLGIDYRCIQAHTTQAGWTPPVVPALWEVV